MNSFVAESSLVIRKNHQSASLELIDTLKDCVKERAQMTCTFKENSRKL